LNEDSSSPKFLNLSSKLSQTNISFSVISQILFQAKSNSDGSAFQFPAFSFFLRECAVVALAHTT
jgi:hypothetical protein